MKIYLMRLLLGLKELRHVRTQTSLQHIVKTQEVYVVIVAVILSFLPHFYLLLCLGTVGVVLLYLILFPISIF